MTEFYSNLPQKTKDSLQKTADRLVDTDYKTKFEFAANLVLMYVDQFHPLTYNQQESNLEGNRGFYYI